jgi:hypothetical protein
MSASFSQARWVSPYQSIGVLNELTHWGFLLYASSRMGLASLMNPSKSSSITWFRPLFLLFGSLA